MTDHSRVSLPTPAVSSCSNPLASLSLQSASPLERLPTELLRQILEYAMPRGRTITFTKYQTTKMFRPKIRVTTLTLTNGKKAQLHGYVQLLKICRRVTREIQSTYHTG
jgi:hypothetical protein